MHSESGLFLAVAAYIASHSFAEALALPSNRCTLPCLCPHTTQDQKMLPETPQHRFKSIECHEL